MIEVLFAFVLSAGGYTGWCQEHPGECVPPIVVAADKDALNGVVKGRGGHVLRARPNVIVISSNYPEGSLMWQMVYVHETAHYMQIKTRRYDGHNPYERKALMEKESYELGDKFLISKGHTPLNSKEPAKLMEKAQKARELGLVK